METKTKLHCPYPGCTNTRVSKGKGVLRGTCRQHRVGKMNDHIAGTPKVMIAIPTLTARIHAKLIQSILPLLRVHTLAVLAGKSPVARARNILIEQFLASDATHIWFIDDDTIPPADALNKLLALKTPIASGITPIVRDTDIVYNAFTKGDDSLDPMGNDDPRLKSSSFKADAVGSSCLLVAREVFEKLESPPYFFDVWTEANQFISEDIMFCNITNELGYTVMVDPSVRCLHARDVVI